jgi:hypothetical protein
MRVGIGRQRLRRHVFAVTHKVCGHCCVCTFYAGAARHAWRGGALILPAGRVRRAVGPPRPAQGGAGRQEPPAQSERVRAETAGGGLVCISFHAALVAS